jgi:hypothetical protein
MKPLKNGSRVCQATLDAINRQSGNGRMSVNPSTIIDSVASDDDSLKLSALTCLNELLRGGVLAFGSPSDPAWNPAILYVTETGRKTLEHATRDPINQLGYLAYLDQEAPIDATTRGYIEEALNTYRACCYKATAILVGAATENLVFDLRDELFTRLHTGKYQVPKNLNDWRVKTALEAMASRLIGDLDREMKATKDASLRRLHEEASARLSPLAAEFRKTRNDAGSGQFGAGHARRCSL